MLASRISGIAPLTEPAFAGAWTQKAGEQQRIATVSRGGGDFGEAWPADDRIEAGFGRGWGVNLKVVGEVRIAETFG
jgi:hypothetical protein